ncbi:hypothetical protein CA13_52320 [Planctomycetes bacterium CA13]|uniref:Polysaccharide biosynthesis/export protein n=1 Tax=Novipirellula herctigrandis TaxID=2527986 RepID=A0A5C5ZAC8_9BACT|nr:hypothetical protein CA13_52320 [Planctomycetes bacterium CA13]
MHQPANPTYAKVLLFSLFALSFTGCASFDFPSLDLSPDGTKYVSGGGGGEFNGFDETMDETVYNKVREAQANNAIVFQVQGDSDASRVLPLPPDGKSVFVSTLLTQSGAVKKMGGVAPILYRSSPQSIGGVRMAVKMSPGGKTVVPESDYALRPGDRVYVQRSAGIDMKNLFSATLGI